MLELFLPSFVYLLKSRNSKREEKNKMSTKSKGFIFFALSSLIFVATEVIGQPMEEADKTLSPYFFVNLRPVDKFNVLLFSGGASVMSEQSLPVTPENIHHAINLIDREKGGGGTELLPALRRALTLPRSEGCSRTIIIATDGYVTVEEEAFDLIRKSLGKANMFTFGIGAGVNRYLIEGMARVGMGEPFVITRPEETREKAEKFRKMIESPLLTDVRISFGKFDAYDTEPISIPDLLAERPVIVFGKWRGSVVKGIYREGHPNSDPFDGIILSIRIEKKSGPQR